jgi:hypothetical protein
MFCPVGSNLQLKISAYVHSASRNTQENETKAHRVRAGEADDRRVERTRALHGPDERALARVARGRDGELGLVPRRRARARALGERAARR